MQKKNKRYFTKMIISLSVALAMGVPSEMVCAAQEQSINSSYNPFGDVPNDSWQYIGAKYVYEKGIMTGKGSDAYGHVKFAPEDKLTRQEFAQILYSDAGKPKIAYNQRFSDVADGEWYTSAVLWAADKGIVSGNPDGTYGVDDEITREQLAAMLYKYAEYKGYSTSGLAAIDGFEDSGQVSSWAVTQLKWAVGNGIMSGKGTKLDPVGNATRAECATMLRKFFMMAEEPDAGTEWEAFEENVTLTIPVYDRGAEGIPDIGENYWETWIQENFGDKYNITMEFVPIIRSDVLTSYALLAAAEDLPTILMEYDYPKQAMWAADGYLTTYDMDAFAKIAPTYYNRMVENNQLGYTELQGETYFVLAERPYYNTNYTYVTWYREDWLKQIGYEEYPATWAEEKEMLQKLVDEGICKHPLGGVQVKGAGVDQNYAYRSFPLDEKNWAAYGDYAIPALGDAANKALLKRVNEQYHLGYLEPEYYLIDLDTEMDNFINGKSVQYSGYISSDMQWLKSFYEQNPDGDLAVKVARNVSDPEGGTVPAVRANNPFGMMISFSSQASEDEIKAAMMYLEWMTLEENLFTMQWGFEGEHFEYDDTGLPVSIKPYVDNKDQGYNYSKDYWCVTKEARNAGTIEDIISAASPKGLPEDFTQEIIDNYYGQLEIAEAGYAVSDCNFAVTIQSLGNYPRTLLSLYEEYRMQLTMCAPEEFDALYEELAAAYAKAGYQKIVDERLAAYEAGYSTRLPK